MSLYSIVNLTMKRGSANDKNSVEATWGFTGREDWGYDGWFDEVWTFNASKNMSQTVTQQTGQGSATGDIVWTRGGESVHTSAGCYYNRSKYHPLAPGRYLNSVTVDVINGVNGYNPTTAMGNYNGAKHSKLTMAFKTPRAPVIAEPSYDGQTGKVSFAITTDVGNDEAERYDTMYCITRQDSSNRNNTYKNERIVTAWTSTNDTSVTPEIDISDAQSVTYGQWVKVTCKAYSRGLKGDSATVTKTFYYSYPAQASITSIVCSGVKSTDSVTVRLSTNASASFPVDSVKLQRLRSSTETNADAAGLASGWADVSNAVDNGTCTGLVDYVPDAIPNVRTHTWYRLVTTHGALARYSVPVEATCLYRAKDATQDDVVTFVSLVPGTDGQSLVARLAWNDDDSNTTQVSWARFEDAWESTQQPEIYDVTWEDPTPYTGYDHSATVSVRGLEESSEYYVCARRANKTANSETHGEWCYPDKSLYPISTAIAPSDVVLWAPATVERGSGIDCYWTYSGAEQTAWQLLYKVGDDVKELLSGEGTAGAVTIPAAKVEGMDSILLAVSVTVGGDWATSAYVPVSIADAPTLGMTVGSTLTAQPLSVSFSTSVPTSNVTVYVKSRGVSSATPDGNRIQAEGDVVWASVISPSWSASANAWIASVTAPADLELYEGATYDVTASATDAQTQLSSDGATASFTVAWAHRAQPAADGTEIAVTGLEASITPEADPNAEDTDVCDVYRLTPDGAYLIASDVPFGTTVKDRFAPFSRSGSNKYRLCTRTTDGDIAWEDFEYALKRTFIRIDWTTGYIELPYNIVVSDSWGKDFELRKHLDGSVAGYWGSCATRSASLSTDVIKVDSEEQREALASLAKHAGPAFVRIPEGSAFPANVTVESYGVSYNSQAVPVSISCAEVAITDEFRISPEDWGDE